MTYYCPQCEANLENSDQSDPLPVSCPECGADLYPEEIIYQQLISENDKDVVLV